MGRFFNTKLVAFFSVFILLIFEVDRFASQTKTIVGHNLEPTPWHVFPPKSFDEASRYSRASKIIQCSYLSCGRAAAASPKTNLSKDIEPQLNDCPEFFSHIHQDLEPWAKSKISIEHINEAQKFASLRMVIVGGKLYVDYYYDCVQSRTMFTVWGVMQLLRRYPGRIPDVDLMFDCMDKPSINRTEHSSRPLPLFRYCTTREHFDIPFPDWSFWGWPEINVEPWNEEFKSIKQGSRQRSWAQKWAVAYWKGNPDVFSPVRLELLQCNDTQMWGAKIMRQDWGKAVESGFKDSKLSKQCDYRYKIYAEGYAWSVSLKYILSCGSLPLIISPEYEDFFTRGLIPKKNYLPVPPTGMCPVIKSFVDWGNKHPSQAESIGRAAQNFMGNLSMDRVYDYMYHLITEYSKLQDFKPVRPSNALEICVDSVFCFADERQRQFLERSFAFPSSAPPCSLPPPPSSVSSTQGEKI
ncbi:hypothetical protein Adt_31159 [Abeliophyllum distichum]|uniref:Glycosyl transferase CAP10 domain-containing protein n=1 Tax=Abeliophyllum distichum TaxID=126358 RepID=A0ABD1RDF9_9LAMI